MNRKNKICCFTGHRPKGFLWDYYDKHNQCQQEYLSQLSKIIATLIQQGFSHFISGGAMGADMDFAEFVLWFRKKRPYITLEIAVPCPNQTLKWSQKEKDRYQNILSQADEVNIISERYTPDCTLKRNRYMVDKSSCVVGAWNGETKGDTYSTIRYAEKLDKQVEIIFLETLTPEWKEEDRRLREVFQLYYLKKRLKELNEEMKRK